MRDVITVMRVEKIITKPLYSSGLQNVRSNWVCLEIDDYPHSKHGHKMTWLDIDYFLFEALEF